MNINELYKRRIRIEGKLEDTRGFDLHVYDLETGEEITNVARITVYLDAKEKNYADVIYYEVNEQGKLATKYSDPVIRRTTLDNPEISVTASERFSDKP